MRAFITYDEFRKLHPATRCFQRYTSEQRADHAASFRLGWRKRQAVGEFYYVHDMVPDIAFPTAKMATTRAYQVFVSNTRVKEDATGLRVDIAGSDGSAEIEAMAIEESMAAEQMRVRKTCD